jgi:excisionase family DNA binding protein
MPSNVDLANRAYLTVKEVASMLGVHPFTIWRYCHDGRLASYKTPRYLLIAKRDLAEFMAGCKSGS